MWMPGEHSDGWESYWTYPDRWGVPHLEPLNVLRYLRRADGNGASSASSSKPEMTAKLDYIQLAGNTFFFRSSHGASSYIHVYKYIYIYICIYFHTVRLWPPLGMMRWMNPFMPRCFLVAFVHRYRLGYVPLSYYIILYIYIYNQP